jgi:hypothetical protein
MTKHHLSLIFALIGFVVSSAPAAEPATQPTFVAVGYGGRRMSSADGVTWSNLQQWAEDGGDDSNNLISVAYGRGPDGKGKYVAVGGGGWSKDSQAGHILVSDDGKSWREVKKMSFRVHPVLFAPAAAGGKGGRFIAGGPDRTLVWSDDGESWHDGAKIDPKVDPGWAFWFRAGATGNGVFLFRGNADAKQKTQWFATTPDGDHLTTVGTDLPEGTSGPAFGAGKFLMIAPGGVCLASADGAKWDRSTIPSGEDLSYVLWTGKRFLAAGKKAVLTSRDGTTWEKLANSIPCHMLFADESRHVFIGTTWPGQMWSSSDGIKWTRGEPLPKDGINCVAADNGVVKEGAKE